MCLNLDMSGICISTGSACSSTSLEAPMSCWRSRLDPVKAACVLCALPWANGTTDEEIDKVLETLPRIVAKLRAMSPLYKNLDYKKPKFNRNSFSLEKIIQSRNARNHDRSDTPRTGLACGRQNTTILIGKKQLQGVPLRYLTLIPTIVKSTWNRH